MTQGEGLKRQESNIPSGDSVMDSFVVVSSSSVGAVVTSLSPSEESSFTDSVRVEC